jgi:hypothetical protein
VALQCPVELGLPVLVIAQRRVELRDRLQRHERPEKRDGIGRMPHVGEEIGSGVAERDAHLILGQQDGIHDHTFGLAGQRDHQRHGPVATAHAPHEVRAFPPVEDGLQHLDAFGTERSASGGPGPLDLLSRLECIPLRIGIGHAERIGGEQRANGSSRIGGRGHRPEGDTVNRSWNSLESEVQILELGIRSHGIEHAAGNRIEEGLGDLGGEVADHGDGVRRPHLRPQGDVTLAVGEQRPQLAQRLLDHALVELEPLMAVGLPAEPVPVLEAGLRPLGDRGELPGIAIEGAADDRCRFGREVGHAAVTPQGSRRRHSSDRGRGRPLWHTIRYYGSRSSPKRGSDDSFEAAPGRRTGRPAHTTPHGST